MIYIVPGMGADDSMFRNEWRTLENTVFLNWPQYNGERTLNEIARRVVEENRISDGAVVVGHSLGGMVGCEIAKLKRLKTLVLVSSATRKEEVSKMAKLLHRLAPVTPLGAIQKMATWVTSDTARMFSRSDPDFIRASADAIFEWEGADDSRTPIKRIHGTWDVVITCPSEVDLPLKGGHLVPKTHAAACVEFIRSLVEQEIADD